MAQDWIVVPFSEAQQAREAIGRLFAASLSLPWPIPAEGTDPDLHVGDTLYYVDPAPSVDSSQVAFGPRDSVIEACLGQTITTNDGSYTLPTACETLDGEWFLNPPYEEPSGPPPPPMSEPPEQP